jgi:hypothetical protein
MKTFVKVLIVLGIIAIVIMLSVNYFISKMFEREEVVFVVEENLDTRFDVKDIDVNIFSTTPSIQLEDIKFAPRDQYADDQVKVKNRPEIDSENVYLSKLELNIDIPHLIKTEGEIISEVIIGKGSSFNSSETMDQLLSSFDNLSKLGIELDGLSDKIVLDDDVEVKTLFVDGKISFMKDLNLVTGDYDLTLTKESWFDLDNNEHKFNGYVMLSKNSSDKIFIQIDKLIGQKTSQATDRGYSVDTKKIKDKLLADLVKDNRIVIKFISQGNIFDPEVSISNAPGSMEQIVEEAINDAMK